jgi:hypothetical protein
MKTNHENTSELLLIKQNCKSFEVKVGNRVTRIDSPEVEGTVISLHGAQARVYWSQHFSQLVNIETLRLVRKTPGTPRGASK